MYAWTPLWLCNSTYRTPLPCLSISIPCLMQTPSLKFNSSLIPRRGGGGGEHQLHRNWHMKVSSLWCHQYTTYMYKHGCHGIPWRLSAHAHTVCTRRSFSSPSSAPGNEANSIHTHSSICAVFQNHYNSNIKMNKCMSGFKVDLIYTSKVGKSLGHKIPLTIVMAYSNICLADPNRPGNEANWVVEFVIRKFNVSPGMQLELSVSGLSLQWHCTYQQWDVSPLCGTYTDDVCFIVAHSI